MKFIMILFAFQSFSLFAQFPAPYCDIDDVGTTVEPITIVNFAQIGITNTDSSSILVDATDQIDLINFGETHTLEVFGNTEGDFENDIVAFIDWNLNDVLDDANEVYFIGTLVNSNGNDGISVSLEIAIPDDALSGSTRVRITKTYKDEDSPAEVDPCAIAFNPFGQGVFPGFGQAIDFIIQIGLIGVDDFDVSALSVYPQPAKDILNVNYTSTISSLEVYNILGQQVLSESNVGANQQLDTSSLKPGSYFLKLFIKGESHSVQFVKQ